MQPFNGAKVWELHATHGFPIDLSIPELADRDYVVTWIDLLAAAKKDGAKLETLIPRLCDVVTDAYAPEFARVVCARLRGLELN